ncbi:phospholipid-transporting ATPase [Achlya hypogyna]|uniref:Phospholipid-transporting ATPase n=1 Tax=Achlya hypogyna TaxID=1202772 RepID=A0A1V9Z918_ACHHY|nr:phospholipid-transporting ATPase [Achlya hypogyna]
MRDDTLHVQVHTDQPSSPYRMMLSPHMEKVEASTTSSAGKDEFRVVHVNAPAENAKFGYCSNTIITSRYTIINFLPKILWYEFSKLANFYFLVISVMQCIKPISNTGGFPASLPALIVIVTIDMAFAAMEDYRRHVADDATNFAPVQRYCRQNMVFETCASEEIAVGDIIKVVNREVIPADCVILGTFEANPENPKGICYVETKSLDGETNLKLRQGLECTYTTIQDDSHLADLEGRVLCETPNNSIHRFSGSLTLADGKQEAIGVNAVLLRGCTLRNTEFVYGLVVNTGRDTKIMMASQNKKSVKWSNMERRLNTQIMYICGLMVVLCLFGAIGATVWNRKYLSNRPAEKAWYLYSSSRDVTVANPVANFFLLFLYFFLLLNSFIPVSLYVSMTSVKFFQAYFMNNDLKMYHAESDTPCQVRTMSLNEELGQVDYVFSDKTGTLTCNIMEFRKCSINGVAYGLGDTEVGLAAKRRQGKLESPLACDLSQHRVVTAPFVNFQDDRLFLADPAALAPFWEHLAVCHTVMPETSADGSLRLSASSPDEQALVAAAACFGFRFCARAPGEAQVERRDYHDGDALLSTATYKVLDVLEFNSTRKRMSVVAQTPSGSLVLLCKGADTVIYERLAESTNPAVLNVRKKTLEHMETFASEGLRTLVIASAPVDPVFYESWSLQYRRAINDMREIELRREGEPNAIDRLMEEMEKDLQILGATAIEDKLQDGVPDAIAKLREAAIKVWMLTGDKQETAINIGFACQLLHMDMDLVVIGADDHPDIASIRARLESANAVPLLEDGTKEDHGLVMDGETLELALLHCPLLLLSVAQQCAAVIACRVSPAQKAELVQLVKENVPTARTLAIGDGANDVSMILSAHIGVGISGQEGMQAANSADYAIAQFRFLKRLLFVHGRWNYNRMSIVILYIFYKNVMMNLTQYWYMFFTGYSGQKWFLEWGLQGYNLLFTAVPIVVVGAMDQDLPDYICEGFPRLYRMGQGNTKFNTLVVWRWILSCIWQSMVICLFTVYGLELHHSTTPMWVMGACAFSIVIVVVTLKLALHQYLITTWHVLLFTVSSGLWPVVAVVVSVGSFSLYWTGTYHVLLAARGFWLILPLAVFAALSRDYFWKGYQRAFTPTYTHLAQEVHCFQWHQVACQLLAYPPPPTFCLAELKAAAKADESLATSMSPMRTSLSRKMRGTAFSYDADSVMAQGFMATDLALGKTRMSFDRHASRGSMAMQMDLPNLSSPFDAQRHERGLPPRSVQSAALGNVFGHAKPRRARTRRASSLDQLSEEDQERLQMVRRFSARTSLSERFALH